MKESKDIGRAEDNVEAIQQRLQQLEADFKADTNEIIAKMDPLLEQLEPNCSTSGQNRYLGPTIGAGLVAILAEALLAI